MLFPRSIQLFGYDIKVDVRHLTDRVNENLVEIAGQHNAIAAVVSGSGGDTLGFYGSPGTTKPEITGSTGGNIALQNLLAALGAQGFLTDSTT